MNPQPRLLRAGLAALLLASTLGLAGAVRAQPAPLLWEETPYTGFLGPKPVYLVARDANGTIVLNEENKLSTISAHSLS